MNSCFRMLCASGCAWSAWPGVWGQSMEVLWCEKQGSGPLDHLERHFGRETAYEGQAEEFACISTPRPSPSGMVPARLGNWRLRDTAGGIWACVPGIWRFTARYFEACSAGTASRPISAARNDLLEKPPITMLLGALDAVTAALTRRTCSAA